MSKAESQAKSGARPRRLESSLVYQLKNCNERRDEMELKTRLFMIGSAVVTRNAVGETYI